jgi:hypothetical protein
MTDVEEIAGHLKAYEQMCATTTHVPDAKMARAAEIVSAASGSLRFDRVARGIASPLK